MPCKARIDAPEALHHIICRGIELKIFNNDTDRENFIDRLVTILKETSTPCYGWALIPNHFHLLLRSERILGDSDFVKEILAEQKESFERHYWLQAQGYNIERVVEKVAKIFEKVGCVQT
jgi:hypothetical protein